jgi:hypothetical protein
MDEFFTMFLKEFGEQINRRVVPVSSLDRYRLRLPRQLLKYWEEFGWAGYSNGLFWIVNPQEYEGVVSSWLEGTEFEYKDEFHVIARSAFGELFLCGEKFGPVIRITTMDSYAIVPHIWDQIPEDIDLNIRCLFAFMSSSTRDSDGFFELARKKLGTLDDTQMYGFVPALALGGPRDVEKLQKLSAVEHLTLLAQLEELTILRLPEL